MSHEAFDSTTFGRSAGRAVRGTRNGFGYGRVTNTMRRVVLVLAFISLPLLAQAADCFVGKWKLDTEKSYVDSSYIRRAKLHADLKFKRGSATFTPEANGYTFEMSAVSNDGNWQMAGPAPFGHAYRGAWGGKAVVFAAKRVGDHSFKILIANEQTRKVTEVLLFNVSSDGTMLVFSDLPVGARNPSLTFVFNKR